MNVLTIILSVLLSVISTAVMSYIAMATPIGPWIAPTLVLFGMIFFRLFSYHGTMYTNNLSLTTISGSIGGILATACGFSFPTLYFLDPQLFNSWMSSPIYFCAIMAGLALSAGAFGIWIANMVEERLIFEEKLAFPIGELVHKMIAAQNQVKKAYELAAGFVGTTFFCFLQDGLGTFKGVIPKSFTLIPAFHVALLQIPLIRFDIWPLFWAVGFVTGHVIALPLAVGALSKIFVVDPINTLFFSYIVNGEFVLAFCSGMVLSSALVGFVGMPTLVTQAVHKVMSNTTTMTVAARTISRSQVMEFFGVAALAVSFLTYFNFSASAQAYLLLFTLVCTYQIAVIAGKIGLAQLGRFATFVMVPAMFIFKLDFVQIVLIATFVEIAGGVAADVLFGRKIAFLNNIEHAQVKRYQYAGLCISALCIGIIFWLLINHFGLGSSELFASRAQARQLLINAQTFDIYVVLIGFVFGFVLKYAHMNPMLVLTGLLMPINYSLGLILGGLLTYLTKEKEAWYPLWSGIFAANSVWILLKTLL